MSDVRDIRKLAEARRDEAQKQADDALAAMQSLQQQYRQMEADFERLKVVRIEALAVAKSTNDILGEEPDETPDAECADEEPDGA